MKRVPLLCVLLLAWAAQVRADTISGTAKDPSSAVVTGARIEITGGGLPESLLLTSNESGKFVGANLTAGKYSIRGGIARLQPPQQRHYYRIRSEWTLWSS